MNLSECHFVLLQKPHLLFWFILQNLFTACLGLTKACLLQYLPIGEMIWFLVEWALCVLLLSTQLFAFFYKVYWSSDHFFNLSIWWLGSLDHFHSCSQTNIKPHEEATVLLARRKLIPAKFLVTTGQSSSVFLLSMHEYFCGPLAD